MAACASPVSPLPWDEEWREAKPQELILHSLYLLASGIPELPATAHSIVCECSCATGPVLPSVVSLFYRWQNKGQRMGCTAGNRRPSANPFQFTSPTFFPKEKLRERKKAGERECWVGGVVRG